MTTAYSWKRKTLHEMEPRKFYDFIGEVCFIKDEFNPLRTILYMTDYTENDLLPPHDGSEGRPKGKRTVIVTLWDSHSEDARNLQVSVGHIVYLKNLNSKIDRDGRLELVMHGPQTFGYRQINPVQVLDVNDDLAKGLRTQRSRYNADQIKEQRHLEAEQAGNSTIPLSISAAGSSTILPAALVSSGSSSSGSSSSGPTTYMQRAVSTRPMALTSAAESSTRSASPVIKTETRSPTPYISNKRQRGTMELSKTPLHSSIPPIEASVAPTILLRDKLKEVVRRKTAEGDQYQRLYAHVIGFAPESIMDFSVPTCHRCEFKEGPLSDKKVPSKCTRCNHSDTFKFEYRFMLRLKDDIGQEFDVHVDNAGAQELLGPDAPAGNFNKKSELLRKAKEALKKIGVIEATDRTAESLSPIFFDLYIRRSIVSPSGSTANDGASIDNGSSNRHGVIRVVGQPFEVAFHDTLVYTSINNIKG